MITVNCDVCMSITNHFATLAYDYKGKEGAFHICNHCLPGAVGRIGIKKDRAVSVNPVRQKPREPARKSPPCPCVEIGEAWNLEAERIEKHQGVVIPRVLYPLAEGLCRGLQKVWKENKSRQTVEYWAETFRYLFSCPAVVEQGTGWMPTFGWAIGPQTLRKIETRPYPVREEESGEEGL